MEQKEVEGPGKKMGFIDIKEPSHKGSHTL
jgi:hypothetical protein